MRLLCLSNGHGEDAIAIRILTALRHSPQPPEIVALPIVGEGHAYLQAGIPVIGSVKTMPSGGFIYMDGRQLARDIQGGLLSLTWAQIQTVRSWARANGQGGGTRSDREDRGDKGELTLSSPPSSSSPSLILAVGDIVPLLFAWLSGVPYAFVGTAKSEYYLRDEAGLLPRSSWWSDRLERWTGCVYHPWERWLMSRPTCRAVFPRDRITANVLQRFNIPAVSLGNPMMDGLEWSGDLESGGDGVDKEDLLSASSPSSSSPPSLLPLTIVLLPGSRPPEAYENWDVLLQAVNGLIAQMGRSLVVLAAIAPGLDVELLHQMVRGYRWQQTAADTYSVGVGAQQATLVLASDRYAEFLHRADFAIAMAGTATEQFVGLGKPAIVIPGKGPQFTATFAEAQTRLLGVSVSRVEAPMQVTAAIQRLLNDPERLHLIAKNGQRRMGEPGAADRIARCLLELPT
ncbi:lipid-A-disaccharide synthase-related protein [Pantanalinema sp. GBBB05]|uniref:lipid-A-disaccharide synthase-related protein n=1 Tax=Pantanalinema sp. GBBB05 TaxID=2604139 RepID=UPI001DF7C015|nr:hypothetical protein [Pantanalinema sp. GBBB05]